MVCYKYRVVGHDDAYCKKEDEEETGGDTTMMLGPWIRAMQVDASYLWSIITK